jgi:hypothetical protein
MTNNIAQYTMKVWLTSVLVSPVLFVLVLVIKQDFNFADLISDVLLTIGIYVALVIGQIIFSILTWFVFWLAVELICKIPLQSRVQTIVIFFVAILLTVGTFLPIALSFDVPNDGSGLINLMYANCAGIGWGVWHYKLDIKAKKPDSMADEA